MMYTAPARGDSIRTDAEFAGFRMLLEPFRARPWIWVFDCRGMTAKHFMNTAFIKRMGSLLESDHAASLRAVWILNPNTWIRAALSLFGSGDKAQLLPTERLELFVRLQKVGCSHALVDRFLAVIAPSAPASPTTPHQGS